MIGIAAISINRVIGDAETNTMPWPFQKDDLAYFKQLTWQKPLLFGRKTFDTLPHLRERKLYVLTAQLYNPLEQIFGKDEIDWVTQGSVKNKGYTFITDLEFIEEEDKKDLIVCGGAKIYQQFLKLCDEFYLTQFNFIVNPKQPVFFPFSDSELNQLFPIKEKIKEITNGIIYKYTKKV